MSRTDMTEEQRRERRRAWDAEWRRKNHARILEYQRAYREAHRAEVNESARRWREKHPEWYARWFADTARRDAHNKQCLAKYHLEGGRAKRKATEAAWKARDPEGFRASAAARTARSKAAAKRREATGVDLRPHFAYRVFAPGHAMRVDAPDGQTARSLGAKTWGVPFRAVRALREDKR